MSRFQRGTSKRATWVPSATQQTTEIGMGKTDLRDKQDPSARPRPPAPPPPPPSIATQAYLPLPLEEETASIKPATTRRRGGPAER